MKRILPLIALLSVMAITFSGCEKRSERLKHGESGTHGTLVMACDESFRKIMDQEIEVFEYQYPYSSILCRYLPEKAAVDSFMNDSQTRVAVISHELTDKQLKYLKDHHRTARGKAIAVDAIAVIANSQNPIDALTVGDLKLILTGELTDWSKVWPGNKSGEIKVVFDYEGSSTVSYMSENVMDGEPFGSNVYAQNSNEKVFDIVSKTKGAIGIIGVSWISSDLKRANWSVEQISNDLQEDKTDVPEVAFSDDVKVLGIRKNELEPAYKPYQAYIFDGSYPLFRQIWMYSIGSAQTLAGGFYTFVTGNLGQKLISGTGVVPMALAPRVMDVK